MILYHASSIKNLTLIKPQPTKSNNVPIGNFVFATENKLLAIMYLANKGVPIMMNPEKKNPTIVICADATSYISKDHGGAVYELPGKYFINTPQKKLSEFEKVSIKPVAPLRHKIYETSLSAMREAGIKIYFVDHDQFKNLINNPRQRELISSLNRY